MCSLEIQVMAPIASVVTDEELKDLHVLHT